MASCIGCVFCINPVQGREGGFHIDFDIKAPLTLVLQITSCLNVQDSASAPSHSVHSSFPICKALLKITHESLRPSSSVALRAFHAI